MGTLTLPTNMKVALVLAFVASAYAAPDTRFTCSECVSEMHKLGGLVKMGAVPIHDYIVSNYCPTLEHNHDQDFCVDSLSKYYVGMLVTNVTQACIIHIKISVCHREPLLCGRSRACMSDWWSL